MAVATVEARQAEQREAARMAGARAAVGILVAAVLVVVGSAGVEGEEARWVGRCVQARAVAAQEAVATVVARRVVVRWAGATTEVGVSEEAAKAVVGTVEECVASVEVRAVETEVDFEAVAGSVMAARETV